MMAKRATFMKCLSPSRLPCRGCFRPIQNASEELPLAMFTAKGLVGFFAVDALGGCQAEHGFPRPPASNVARQNKFRQHTVITQS